ncbi:hypothetical protein BCON_0424g00090 [Botryotinia convoluta]|uniref:Uncharacterized protein n=1 Tax=Botryotinia convoluta TaxID=54673 RepID=A0A4Z1HCC9_9HELO|nr:hypothetical protein BCON_0424g00090 [Botryotinia convoluta]
MISDGPKKLLRSIDDEASTNVFKGAVFPKGAVEEEMGSEVCDSTVKMTVPRELPDRRPDRLLADIVTL